MFECSSVRVSECSSVRVFECLSVRVFECSSVLLVFINSIYRCFVPHHQTPHHGGVPVWSVEQLRCIGGEFGVRGIFRGRGYQQLRMKFGCVWRYD